MAKARTGRSYKQKAYQFLKEAIMVRELRPGSKVSERILAARLKMSRTPVREAIYALRDEGWIAVAPWRGAVVRPVTRLEIDECTHLRMAIEPYAVELAMPRMGAKEIAYLDSLTESQKSIAGQEAANKFITIDQSFHLYIAELTGNGRLLSIMRSLRDVHLRLGVEAVQIKQRYETTLSEHMAIVDALRTGNGPAAADAMRDHLRRTRDALLAWFEASRESGEYDT